MQKKKSVGSCGCIMVFLCILIPLVAYIIHAKRAYHDEKEFFNQHVATFSDIVELARRNKTPGCVVLKSTEPVIGKNDIHVCFDTELEIKFLWVASRNPGPLYCYIPNAKKSDDVPFAETAYSTKLYAELPNHWFVCDSANHAEED